MNLPGVVAKLGTVLEVRVESKGKLSTLHWPDEVWLCGDPSGRRLFLLPRPSRRARQLKGTVAEREEVQQAISLFKRWSDFQPAYFNPTQVRDASTVDLGRVRAVAYSSDKWSGTANDYEHQFKGAPRLRQAGSLYVISGGGLSVTPSGIRG